MYFSRIYVTLLFLNNIKRVCVKDHSPSQPTPTKESFLSIYIPSFYQDIFYVMMTFRLVAPSEAALAIFS